MLSVFFSYAHEDELLRDQLEQQLAILKRQQVLSTWHDRRIVAGQEIDHSINEALETADIVLLLVSSAFLASDYCYDREMARAMERHEAKQAVVIPVILRACAWHGAPFGKLMATPVDGRPVTLWPDRDQAFLEVANAIRAAAQKVCQKRDPAIIKSHISEHSSPQMMPTPITRSSNLSITKLFNELDKDVFKLETFAYIARYFENSLAELSSRNHGIDGTFRQIDANRFGATAYRDGKVAARCTIFMDSGNFLNGIAYSATETNMTNSFNESLTVQADDQMLYLQSMGMSHYSGGIKSGKLSQEGAAELYWGIFIQPLQCR